MAPELALVTAWRSRAEQLAPYAPAAAQAFRDAASELEKVWNDASAEAVSLAEAHRIGGYSVDHLQRLVASGALENVGKKGKPRIRIGDVPVKPGHRLPDTKSRGQLDRSAVVASVIPRRVSA
jgi:hypothetical protein